MAPGPGAYEAPSAFHLSQQSFMPTSSFHPPLKKSDKFHKDREQKPDPGAYDPRIVSDCSKVVRVPGKGEGFLGSSIRGKEIAPKNVPGPGTYYDGSANMINTEASIKSHNKARNLSFLTSGERFSQSHNDFRPGPGAYDRTIVGGVGSQKSHNVLFNRDLVL